MVGRQSGGEARTGRGANGRNAGRRQYQSGTRPPPPGRRSRRHRDGQRSSIGDLPTSRRRPSRNHGRAERSRAERRRLANLVERANRLSLHPAAEDHARPERPAAIPAGDDRHLLRGRDRGSNDRRPATDRDLARRRSSPEPRRRHRRARFPTDLVRSIAILPTSPCE